MPVITNIANLSQTADLNGPSGDSDPPSTLDDQCRYLGAFIAQLRDNTGFTVPFVSPGAIMMHAAQNAPSGWLNCAGGAYSRTTYAALFAAIGTTWGAGDGSTTFNVPDFRGLFPRGFDAGRGVDAGRVWGSAIQWSAYQTHNHGISDPGHNHGLHDPGHAHSAWTDSQGQHNHYVNDPGHAHGNSVAVNQWGLRNENWATFWITQANEGRGATAASGTGIWLSDSGAHGHNVGIGGAGTGMWLDAAGTGISTQNNGGGGETRPANLACLFIIKT